MNPRQGDVWLTLCYVGAVSSSHLIIRRYRSGRNVRARVYLEIAQWRAQLKCARTDAIPCDSCTRWCAKGRTWTARKAKENNDRGSIGKTQRRRECWPAATLKIYGRKAMTPRASLTSAAESAFTLEITRRTSDRNFWHACKAGETREENSATLVSNSCSHTQALKYSTAVSRKESP